MKARERVTWGVLTPVWAAFIFLGQLAYWWALFELSTAAVWTVGDFALTIGLALTLFTAGSFILPDDLPAGHIDLPAHFDSNGRLGVAALGMYYVMGWVGNVVLFETTWGSILDVPTVLLYPTTFGVAFISHARTRTVLTAIYVPVIVWTLATLVPGAY